MDLVFGHIRVQNPFNIDQILSIYMYQKIKNYLKYFDCFQQFGIETGLLFFFWGGDSIPYFTPRSDPVNFNPDP